MLLNVSDPLPLPVVLNPILDPFRWNDRACIEDMEGVRLTKLLPYEPGVGPLRTASVYSNPISDFFRLNCWLLLGVFGTVNPDPPVKDAGLAAASENELCELGMGMDLNGVPDGVFTDEGVEEGAEPPGGLGKINTFLYLVFWLLLYDVENWPFSSS